MHPEVQLNNIDISALTMSKLMVDRQNNIPFSSLTILFVPCTRNKTEPSNYGIRNLIGVDGIGKGYHVYESYKKKKERIFFTVRFCMLKRYSIKC